jgi:hypothetical protein
MGEMQGRMNEMLQEVLRRMEVEFKRARSRRRTRGPGFVGLKGIASTPRRGRMIGADAP